MQNTTPGVINVSQFTGGKDGSGVNTAISGGRKPTADSTAYTLYKPGGKQHLRGKFSNGGGSIDGVAGIQPADPQFQNSVNLMEKNINNNNNFNTNPNTTASRFYNPNKQISP